MKWSTLRRPRWIAGVLAALVIGLIVAAALLGGVWSDSRSSSAGSGAANGYSAAQSAESDTTGQRQPGMAEQKAAALPAPAPSAADGSAGAESGGTSNVSAALPPATNGQYLVRIGSLALVVPKGGVNEGVDRIVTLTRLYDGYVVSSYVGTSGGAIEPQPIDQVTGSDAQTGAVLSQAEGGSAAEERPYAYVTIRVPTERFDQAVAQIGNYGRVKALTTSTDDVTGQVVDLRARLRHYRAVEARLLSFLDKATSVGSALAVQNRIDQTQLTIEELQAQLKQLSETVTYSTLSVTISEKGRHPVAVASTGRGFWGTITHSFSLMGHGFGVIFTGFGAALPFLLLAGALAVAAWLVVRAVRRHGESGREAGGMDRA